MPPAGFFLDANLLVLLVVGSVDQELIAKHRRLRRFATEDYEKLLGLIARVERVFVTPNTLTETSNLLAQHRDPERSRFFDRLRFIIQESEEVVVASAVAASGNHIPNEQPLISPTTSHVLIGVVIPCEGKVNRMKREPTLSETSAPSGNLPAPPQPDNALGNVVNERLDKCRTSITPKFGLDLISKVTLATGKSRCTSRVSHHNS